MAAMARPERVDRIGDAEVAEAVAAGPLEGDAVAAAADRGAGDRGARAVDRDEAVDAARSARSLNRCLTPRRSPRPSSPTVPTNVIVPAVSTLDVVQRPDHAEHDRQAAAVVGDPGPGDRAAGPRRLHHCALGKHGVEMGAHHEVRPRLPARPFAEHVADRVDAHVLQAEPLERRLVGAARAPARANGGAGISHSRTCSSMMSGSLARTASSAARIAGSFNSVSLDGGRWPTARRGKQGGRRQHRDDCVTSAEASVQSSRDRLYRDAAPAIQFVGAMIQDGCTAARPDDRRTSRRGGAPRKRGREQKNLWLFRTS